MHHLTRPTLIIDKKRAISNIKSMNVKAQKNNLIFRPHFKTHQSSEVGFWFKNEGIKKITVSSVEMAVFFANNGWDDITIAFPLNIREINELNNLSKKVKINVLISSKTQIEALSKHFIEPVGFFIKTDTGYHRSGLTFERLKEIQEIVTYNSCNLIFKGLVAHFGHTYHVKGKGEIVKIYRDGINYLKNIKNEINFKGKSIISIGDTPSCSVIDNFEGIDEIRPGNFVYYDLMQLLIGSCKEEQIAAVVACPVIDKYPDRNEILIFGGAVHLSKENVIDDQGNKSFGAVVNLNNSGWGGIIPGAFLKSLSQEHGIISCTDKLISEMQIGEMVGIVPVHSCLAANLLKENQYII